MSVRSTLGLFLIIALTAVGCSDDSDRSPAGGPVEPEVLDVFTLVETLTSDEFAGRDNLSPGSLSAQKFLVEELAKFAQPIFPDAEGDEGFFQHYDDGTNILAVVPGGELADEYVMIGAHYDHHGSNPEERCNGETEEDSICNGASDNAASVAEVIDIVRSLVAEGPPRRSILVTLWDGEEDGLVGSKHYVENPVIPLEQTIAYVNFDIQGANLLQSLRNFTVLIGAETGGQNLVDAAKRAIDASTLDTLVVSLIFGQGRSDHARLVGAGVPSVFFSDATNGCYHTVKDDIDAVDFPKLEQQILAAAAITRELLMTDDVPTLNTSAPLASYDDAVEFLRLLEAAQVDFGQFTPEEQVSTERFLVDLHAIVDAGPEAFDGGSVGTLLVGISTLISTVSSQECNAYLTDG
jgi:hypothetical protein